MKWSQFDKLCSLWLRFFENYVFPFSEAAETSLSESLVYHTADGKNVTGEDGVDKSFEHFFLISEWFPVFFIDLPNQQLQIAQALCIRMSEYVEMFAVGKGSPRLPGGHHVMFVFDSVAECIPGPARPSGPGFPPNLLKIVRFCAASQRDETSIANDR